VLQKGGKLLGLDSTLPSGPGPNMKGMPLYGGCQWVLCSRYVGCGRQCMLLCDCYLAPCCRCLTKRKGDEQIT